MGRKILVVNDIHATRRPPGWCTDSYWPDLLDLLYQTAEVARQREAAAVVWSGDVLHHKAPSRTDHGIVQELSDVAGAYPCPVYAVPGNHDMQHDRPESIDATQPLGVLFRAGVRRLEGRCPAFPRLYGVPWQQEWSGETVREALRGYREDEYAQHAGLVVAHAPVYPPGREPGYPGAEFTPASWWAEAMGGQGCLAYGHIHEPHDTWAHAGVTFCNYGALSRGSLDEYNLERQVGCALWDEGSGRFEFVPLRAKPASEVFRLAEHGTAQQARVSLASFMAGVQRTVLPRLSVEHVIKDIRAAGHPADVADLAEELLTAQQGE